MCTTNCSHFLHCEARDRFYSCSCRAGFTGDHCEININDCSPNSCLNGKCVDGVNRFECLCDKGYYGDNCEKKIVSEGGETLGMTPVTTIMIKRPKTSPTDSQVAGVVQNRESQTFLLPFPWGLRCLKL